VEADADDIGALGDEATAELPMAGAGVSVRPSCCCTVPLSHGIDADPEALLDDEEAMPPSAATEAGWAKAGAVGVEAVSQGRAGRSVSLGRVGFTTDGSKGNEAPAGFEGGLGDMAGNSASSS